MLSNHFPNEKRSVRQRGLRKRAGTFEKGQGRVRIGTSSSLPVCASFLFSHPKPPSSSSSSGHHKSPIVYSERGNGPGVESEARR